MSTPLTAAEMLDREFLTFRAKLVDLAAALDRIDRAEGSVDADPRIDQLRRGLELLASPGDRRAERMQMAFSLPDEPTVAGGLSS
ncbi:MAG TPA: hypothetical protein DD670_07250 [Planctomycetaceae bacterium]|nr:hypothetical protein [Planctomycetaceae bacterium]